MGPGWHLFDESEKEQILDVLNSKEFNRYRFNGENKLSKTMEFERFFSNDIGSSHAIGMNSCTSALYCGLLSLGIGPGDEVIVPAYTFIASISAVVYTGAVPVLAEIDNSLTIDVNDVQKKISPRTKAVMGVHMLGNSCNMTELQKIAEEYKLFLVEDVAQANGGSFLGQKLGSIGDFGVFSLNVFKMITSGDGGILTTSCDDLYKRAFAIHDHGFSPLGSRVSDDNSILGLNFRMNEFVSAIALAQVKKIPYILSRLKKNKEIFKSVLGDSSRFEYRRLNDPDGETATVIVMIFHDKQEADLVAEKGGTFTLVNSGKHVYSNMAQLISKKTPLRKGPPFYSSEFPSDISYSPGFLGQTDQILERSVALSIGVQDSYLGTGYGLNIMSSEEEIALTARNLKKIISCA